MALQSWTSNKNEFDMGSSNFFEKSQYIEIKEGKVILEKSKETEEKTGK